MHDSCCISTAATKPCEVDRCTGAAVRLCTSFFTTRCWRRSVNRRCRMARNVTRGAVHSLSLSLSLSLYFERPNIPISVFRRGSQHRAFTCRHTTLDGFGQLKTHRSSMRWCLYSGPVRWSFIQLGRPQDAVGRFALGTACTSAPRPRSSAARSFRHRTEVKKVFAPTAIEEDRKKRPIGEWRSAVILSDKRSSM